MSIIKKGQIFITAMAIMTIMSGCGNLKLKDTLKEEPIKISSKTDSSINTTDETSDVENTESKIEIKNTEVLKGAKSSKDKPLSIGKTGICDKYEASNDTYQKVNVRVNSIIRGDKAKDIVEKYNKENKFVQINELASSSVEYAVIEYDVSLTDGYKADGDVTAALEMNVKGKDGEDLQYKDVIYTLTSTDISNPDAIERNEVQTLKSVFAIPVGCTDYECVFGDSNGKNFAYFKGV